MNRSASGLHFYGAWFHFAGRILRQPIAPEQLGTQFTVDFLPGSDLAAEAFAGRPLVQVEVTVEIPWLSQADTDPDILPETN